jgi:hypothetical protein
VLVVVVLLVVVDLQHAIGLTIAFDEHVDSRYDAMFGVEGRQHELFVPAQIVTDRWLPGDECAPLRRGLIGARDDVSDHARFPAVPGFDQKIVLRLAVAADFRERHTQTFGADLCRFRQHFQQIVLTQCKTAEAGDRRLLAEKFADHGTGVIHLRTPGG